MRTKKLVAAVLGAQAVGALVQFLSGPILSRLAGPYPFGVFAPVLSVAAIGRLVAESGLSFHVLSAKKLSAGEARDLHGRSIRLSLIIALAAGITASLIGSASTAERVFRGVASATLVVFSGVGAVPASWIQRNGGLGRLSWLTVALSAASTVLAIPLAVLGFGLASVVTNNILVLTALPVYMWWISGISKERAVRANLSGAFRWGTLGASAAHYLSCGADGLVLATYLDPVSLGVYNRTAVLAAIPGTVVATGLASVGQLAMSGRVSREAQLRYLKRSMALTLAAFGVPLLLSALGLDIPEIVFGPKFAVGPLAFAYLTAFNATFFCGTILNTFHQANRRLAAQSIPLLLHAVVALGLLVWLKPVTMERIALILLTASLARCFLLLVLSWGNLVGKKEETGEADELDSARVVQEQP